MRKKDPELMIRILEYVTEYYLNYSSTPSTTQIANEVGIARGTAYKYLVAMDEKGIISYQDGIPLKNVFVKKTHLNYLYKD